MVRQGITALLTTQETTGRGALYTTYYPFKAETLNSRDYQSTI